MFSGRKTKAPKNLGYIVTDTLPLWATGFFIYKEKEIMLIYRV